MKKILIIVSVLLTACSPVSEENVNGARERFERELKGNGVYERGNLPEDLNVEELNGYFDIIQGAYRYVVNEDRVDRETLPVVEEGDVIEIYFDARIYTSSFESSTTFYTNLESRRSELAGSNPEFDPEFWPTDALRLEIPDGGGILKSVQRALVGCRAGFSNIVLEQDGSQTIEEMEGDVVRIFLTPDIGFGSDAVYNVPAGSSLVFEVTDIKIMKD